MEYKIISGPRSNCEKSLNQWKETHDTKVLKMVNAGQENITILIVIKLRRKYEVLEKEEAFD